MNTTLILPSYKRAELLDLGLKSIVSQKIDYPLEILVINDGIEDDTKAICKKYKSKLKIKYLFTGHRNKDEMIWRVPGFAINIGIKQSKSDIIILSCPEIFHHEDSINQIIKPLINNKLIISTVEKVLFDFDGKIKNYLLENDTYILPNKIKQYASNDEHSIYAATLPFFMGFHKSQFLEIGGYDEDFTGYAGEDDDLKNRFLIKGLRFHYNPVSVIHLYHKKEIIPTDVFTRPEWIHNFTLYNIRQGKFLRNEDIEWGKNE